MSIASTMHPALGAAAARLVGEHWIEELRDGSHVLIRPIGPEDRERERAFIARLSPQSQHFRFLGGVNPSDPGLIERMVEVDHHRSMAYVALAHDDGELREVGVSRYAAGEQGDACECAATVADDWRHRGLAVALMRRLIEAARREGFRRMYSIDAAENEDMRDLARFLGFERSADPDDASQVIHTLAL